MRVSFPSKIKSPQLSSNLTPIKKTRSVCCSEICAVCGDQSTGYHYEVPSCNGCKTFFRRTIVSERIFTCNKSGNCLFNKDIRCACRSCRFKKCLEVGMNPKAIQSPRDSKEHPTTHREFSSNHCIHKRTYDICSILDMQPSCSSPSLKCASCSISPSDSTLLAHKNKTKEREMHRWIRHARDLEDRLFLLRNSDFLFSTSLLDVLTRPCALDNLQKYERSPKHFVSNSVDFEKESILAIEYAKSYTWFREMSFSDKYTLLCDRVLLLITLRLARNKVSINVEYHGLWSHHIKSTKEGIERVMVDQTTFALLNAIILCDCGCFSLSTQTKEILKIERDKFLDALGSHLFEKYSPNGPSKMADHISLMWILLKDSRMLREYLLKNLPNPSLARQMIENK